MRDICTVISRIKELIPVDHPVLSSITKLENQLPYRAPELMRHNWFELCVILNEECPNPIAPNAPDWAKSVALIINNKE